ncbi:MAG: ABC transporter ATP-binding protein [Gammaproteobacteria bacterium]|nr:ABC transporter ATP-binding protein [Gammaproteobacteria bacterium]
MLLFKFEHSRLIVNNIRKVWSKWFGLTLGKCALSMAVLTLPFVEKHMIDDGLLKGDYEVLTFFAFLFILIHVITTVLEVGLNALQVRVGEAVSLQWQFYLRRVIFENPILISQRWRHGDIVSLSTQDIQQIKKIVASLASVPCLFTSILIGGIISVYLVGWIAALLIPMLAILAIGAWLVRPICKRIKREALDAASDQLSVFQEDLIGAREIVACGQESKRDSLFRLKYTEFIKAKLRESIVFEIIMESSSLTMVFIGGLVIWIGGKLVIDGTITLGSLIAFRYVLRSFFGPVHNLLTVYNGIHASTAALDRLTAFSQENKSIDNKIQNTDSLKPVITGNVRIKKVTYSYENDSPALREIDFRASPGELVVIVGPNGAGKSTLCDLIQGDLKPTEGKILLDEWAISHIDRQYFKQHLSVIYPRPILFQGIIRDNIAFGKTNVDEQTLRITAQQATILPSISLEMEVGAKGDQLSDGQRQKVAFARILVRDTQLIVMDEPFTAIDAYSVRLLDEVIQDLAKSRTVIIATHRPSLARLADRIYVLDQGYCVGVGKHEDLMISCQIYQSLMKEHPHPYAGQLKHMKP